jgi:hypothetical protein
MAWVMIIASIEYLFLKISVSLISIKRPAITPKSGAVKKNLNGADIGGA